MKLKKNWTICLVAMVSLGFNTACTDEEVALGTGLAIGAASGYAIADRHDGRRDRCYLRTRCHDYRDYYGRWRRECRRERVCRGGDRYVLNVANTQPKLSAVALGSAFAMPYSSADKLIYALEQSAYHKNHDPVKGLGLSSYDASQLAKKKLPSNNGIKKIAKSLDQDPTATKNMVKVIVDRM